MEGRSRPAQASVAAGVSGLGSVPRAGPPPLLASVPAGGGIQLMHERERDGFGFVTDVRALRPPTPGSGPGAS